ncbi:WD repeat-containing protein WRAP73, partial [Caerostris extrusa]
MFLYLSACALQSQLLVWNVESKEVKNKFICDHIIDSLGWSPDSELIYCGMSRKNIIQIWSFNNPTWRCKISENPLSFVDVFWSPDSRHLLVVAEFHLKITVWSLVSTVAERRKCEDYISIYTCDTWEILKFFSVDTKDLSGIYFSPSDLVLGIVEAFTEELKVVFYLIDGKSCRKVYKTLPFGLTCFSWNCNGNLITLETILV